MMDSFKIIEHHKFSKNDFIDPICIIGMPGIADVGKFALDSSEIVLME